MPRRPEPEVMDDDAEARAYAAADFADVNQRFVERLLELAGPCEEAFAVDLGAGPADIPIRLLRARPGWRVVAVDASKPMLDIAARGVEAAGLGDCIGLLLADAKGLPVPSSSFDVVFSNSILHHIEDTDALWTEVQRVAQPGALVLVRDLARPDTDEDADRIVREYAGNESELLRQEFRRSLAAAYTPDEVRRQLERAGLDTLQVAMVSDRHLDVFGNLP
jgi:ubiquinone/menaquinone biosynthesis C-methylase UbiE